MYTTILPWNQSDDIGTKSRAPDIVYCNFISQFQWKTLEQSYAYTSLSLMLVKVNSIDVIKNKAKVTQLDIDDYGSVIPLKDLELNVSTDDDSLIRILEDSSYAAIFTENETENSNGTIILANGMTSEELNKEKSKIIDKAADKK